MKRSFMFICAVALLLTGCGASADEASAQLFAMDTVMQLDAYGHQVKQAVSDAEETIQALEARLSRTREDSLVSVLNQNGAAQDLSAAEQALLSEALTFRDATGGAFDITIAPVMDAWGFTFKTVAFVWIKQCRKSDGLFTGMGYWTRANAEICLLATRGRPKRAARDVKQVILSHVERHSQKPEEARRRIEALMGDVPRIELFARASPPGWDVWGNEVASDIRLAERM